MLFLARRRREWEMLRYARKVISENSEVFSPAEGGVKSSLRLFLPTQCSRSLGWNFITEEIGFHVRAFCRCVCKTCKGCVLMFRRENKKLEGKFLERQSGGKALRSNLFAIDFDLKLIFPYLNRENFSCWDELDRINRMDDGKSWQVWAQVLMLKKSRTNIEHLCCDKDSFWK